MWNKFILYYHTIRHLRWVQIKYRLFYLVRNKWRSLIGHRYILSRPLIAAVRPLALAPSVHHRSSYLGNLSFSFLNLTYTFEQKIDWNEKEWGKLWTYNLNYFEFLHQKGLEKQDGLTFILEFIQNGPDIKDGFEPYPISLRTIYWIKFLTFQEVKSPQINESLYAQLYLLYDQLEYHLLGNHLLENSFALLFGAYYFQDDMLYQKAKSILLPELNEQILPDGSHFELSPMYHQLMLYRVLDCINLVYHNPNLYSQELLPLLSEKAELMLGWLNQISFENGDIPLLNDSALNITPHTRQLSAYARQLGIEPSKNRLNESGYRKIKTAIYEGVVDVGHIGPDYIPGHAHSDTFSFVLRVHGQPLMVDTGTSTYEKNNRRNWERSTQAHNTVQIGNEEQSEVWGGFRVARKARVQISEDLPKIIIAQHNGYAKINASHQRAFRFEEQLIQIEDVISDKQVGRLSKAFFHFHPSVTLSIEENQVTTNLGVIITFKGGIHEINLLTYQYAPTFNKYIEGQKIVVKFVNLLQTDIQLS